MGLFDLFGDLPDTKSDIISDKEILQKKKKSKPNTVVIKGSGSIVDRIQSISSLVLSKFADKKDKLLLIDTEYELTKYIDACIQNGVISIDTETTGLDPILNDIVGMSIYTPGQKAAYMPIGHISYITKELCPNQISRSVIQAQLQRLVDAKVRTYWFNAPFDIRVILNHIGVYFTPYFDGSVAIRILNSAEPQGQLKLKILYQKYCGGEDEALTFGKLFDNLPFNLIPIPVAYLYGASDALYTWEFCDYLSQYLEPTGEFYEKCNMQDLSKVFFDIEMQSMPVFISMEENGIAIDFDYAEELSKKYHALYSKMEKNLWDVYEDYKPQVEEYMRKNPMCKLTDPINFNSPTQLQILLYDVLKLPPVDIRKPRSVDKEALAQLNHPMCNAISDYRKFVKLLSTYIDTLPGQAQEYDDKRLHCHFLQVGAETGRVACKEPNLQQIPSTPFKLKDGTEIDAGHDIRQLFMATPGNVLLSCDYSGQEVRVAAHLSLDKKLIQAYIDGKDAYSEIASLAFNVPYEECCENYPDGTYSPDGDARRKEAKRIVLGVLYGRGIPSIAEQLGKSVQEAREIKDKVLEKFEGLAAFLEESEKMAREFGYVTTVWGRRRQIPDMMLPYYEFEYASGKNPNFDPLSDDGFDNDVPDEIIIDFTRKLLNCYGKEKKAQMKEAIKKKGFRIKDNTSFIAKARRQCVNARVQGSAADLTKKAQILLYNNAELRNLGFRMLLPVHDEIIAECPVKNVKRCSELMRKLMIDAGKDLCVPLECDVALFYKWYGKKLKVEDFEE